MPDHFHGIVQIQAGGKSLGDVVGAFKSRVVHEYIGGVKTGQWPPFPGKIWHRNYYERIIRDQDAWSRIADYIRMNPWKNIIHFGHGMRGIGNPSLWHADKIALLCSRQCPSKTLESAIEQIRAWPDSCCVISGFRSPTEKTLLHALLESRANIIGCPAWGIDTMSIPAEWLPALEQNRMLILEMENLNADWAASRERNRFVLEQAATVWIPHMSQGGMLDRLVKEMPNVRACDAPLSAKHPHG